MPGGATFTDNGNGTGLFSWQTDYNAANFSPYTIGFTASDGEKSDIESCVITINDVNRSVLLDPVGNKSVVEGELLSFHVTASDPDGDLEIIALNLPAGAAVSPVQNGEVSFSWTPDYSAANGSPYSVTFKATDFLTEELETIQITVTNGVAPGTITVVRPKGGINHELGSGNLLVKWKSAGNVGEKVIVELWRKGVYVQKLKVTKNDGRFRWDAPLITPKGKGFSIRVRSRDNPLIVGESGGTFTISKK